MLFLKIYVLFEVCPLLSRDRQSLEFSITRIFMVISYWLLCYC